MGRTIVIIGAGASGLMAAITAASAGASVTLLEHNEKPGKKLLASGNGKCNLTNLQLRADAYRSDHPQLAASVLERFSPDMTIGWFAERGLRTFDRQGWVYPCTEQASGVLDLMLWEAGHLGVKCKNNEEVRAVIPDLRSGTFTVRTAAWEYRADAVILACGSPASRVRGSSDLALRLADQLGIPRYRFLPALVPLKIAEPFSRTWSGARVHAAVCLTIDGEEAISDTGELQLTAYGLSGIPILQVSRMAVPAVLKGRKVQAVIDFLPEMTQDELEAEWQVRETFASYKTYLQLLTGLVPDRIIPNLLSVSGLRPEDIPCLADHEEHGPIETLLTSLKGLPLTVTGAASMEQAQICSGGISLRALDGTLSCRHYPGLYVTGEAAHVDGPCGGYNLQWAWSSGHLAGLAAAGEM